jgi:DNA mismatch repair protein MSH6
LLNRCVTPFGKRLFKVWLCAPLRDVKGINDRFVLLPFFSSQLCLTLLRPNSLDAVEDLLSNSNFAVTFDAAARKLPDLERMLSRIHGKTCKKQDFVKVIASFELISATLAGLKEQCEGFKSQGIEGLLEGAPEIDALLEEIQGLYDSDGTLLSACDDRWGRGS